MKHPQVPESADTSALFRTERTLLCTFTSRSSVKLFQACQCRPQSRCEQIGSAQIHRLLHLDFYHYC